MTRSIGGRDDRIAWPLEDRAPLMQSIEERSRENDRVHRNQLIVLLYGWSHLVDSKDASLL